MKILLISNGFPPRQWAGTETYTAGIAQELQRRGYEVHVLCQGDWDTGERHLNGITDELYNGIHVRRLNLNWWKAPDPSVYLFDNPVTASYLGDFLDEIRPDLVHVTSCITLSASILRVVKEAGIPLVLSLTDFWFLCPRINLFRSDSQLCDGVTTPWDCLNCQMLENKTYQWSSKLLPTAAVSRLLTEASKHSSITRRTGFRGLAVDMARRKSFLKNALTWPDVRITASQFTYDLFKSNGVQEEIMIRPYGHDLSWLGSGSEKTLSKQVRFGYIGQISEYKGVHLLLQAARLLNDLLGKKFIVSVYGNLDKSPAYGEELRTLAQDTDAISFCGTYNHENSAAVYAGIDVLVVPSLWYDFPLIIHEAFASQTPVITTNLGGMAESVQHEVSGLLFERGSVPDLARQMRRIVEEPGLLTHLRSGLPPVKTIQEEVRDLESIYRSLWDKRRRV